MICPRCGFQSPEMPCTLCGQTDFSAYEMARFSAQSSRRFEITVVIFERDMAGSVPVDPESGVLIGTSREKQPRTFYFFPDGTTCGVPDFLKRIPEGTPWSLLINGRLRPYSQELWLPLVELVNLS